jgi:hypothetical protein
MAFPPQIGAGFKRDHPATEVAFIAERLNVRANDAMVCQSHYRLAAICGTYLDILVVRPPSATQSDY